MFVVLFDKYINRKWQQTCFSVIKRVKQLLKVPPCSLRCWSPQNYLLTLMMSVSSEAELNPGGLIRFSKHSCFSLSSTFSPSLESSDIIRTGWIVCSSGQSEPHQLLCVTCSLTAEQDLNPDIGCWFMMRSDHSSSDSQIVLNLEYDVDVYPPDGWLRTLWWNLTVRSLCFGGVSLNGFLEVCETAEKSDTTAADPERLTSRSHQFCVHLANKLGSEQL